MDDGAAHGVSRRVGECGVGRPPSVRVTRAM
jgi:hypothetical protein